MDHYTVLLNTTSSIYIAPSLPAVSLIHDSLKQLIKVPPAPKAYAAVAAEFLSVVIVLSVAAATLASVINVFNAATEAPTKEI